MTEQEFSPVNLHDLDGADIECHKLALQSGHPRPTSFKTWLSTESSSPATRFFRSPGRYVLVTGEVVAESWDDLTDGALAHGIDRTIDGKLLFERPVWTNTRTDGETWGDDKHCEHWSSDDVNLVSRVGASGYADSAWTDAVMDVTCAATATLYCFQQ